jgi:hypothetical protein
MFFFCIVGTFNYIVVFFYLEMSSLCFSSSCYRPYVFICVTTKKHITTTNVSILIIFSKMLALDSENQMKPINRL